MYIYIYIYISSKLTWNFNWGNEQLVIKCAHHFCHLLPSASAVDLEQDVKEWLQVRYPQSGCESLQEWAFWLTSRNCGTDEKEVHKVRCKCRVIVIKSMDCIVLGFASLKDNYFWLPCECRALWSRKVTCNLFEGHFNVVSAKNTTGCSQRQSNHNKSIMLRVVIVPDMLKSFSNLLSWATLV